MAWVAVAGAVIGGVASYSAASKASSASDRAVDANRWQGEIAQEQWDEYKTTYQPLERNMVAEAQNFDSPEAYQRAAGEAQASTAEGFGKARDRLGRTAGLDPSSGAYTAAMAGLEQNQAAVDAVSQNAARAGIRDKAWARRMDALGLGKGLVTNASTGMAAVASGANSIAARQGVTASNTAASTGQFADRLFGSQGFQNWINTPSVQPVNTTTPVVVGDAYWKT